MQELSEELEHANERFDGEKATLMRTQQLRSEDERGMSLEIQELTAITEQLRSIRI